MRFKSILRDVLVEAKKQETIQRVFGLSAQWADEFVNLNEKFSIWAVNTFLDNLSKRLRKEKDFVIASLNKKTPATNSVWVTEYKPRYVYIFDWLRNVGNAQNINLKTLSYQEAFNQAEEWHDSLESKKSENYQEKHEIVIDYRVDGVGFYWAHLNASTSEEEKTRMGHCGSKYGTTLFSLRKIHPNGDGESYVTLARTPEGIVSEVHGKRNSKPKQIYRQYIIDFLLNKKYPVKGLTLHGVYKPEDNFQLEDLTPDELKMLFEKNKDIKFNYIFGDTQIVAYLEDSNDTIALAVRKKMYGLVNLETIELVKPIKYKMDYDSVYTEFVTIDDDYLLMRHYKDDEGNGFITVGDFNMKNPKQYFKIIPLDTAKKLIENENGGN
jgi:hypothetical protein